MSYISIIANIVSTLVGLTVLWAVIKKPLNTILNNNQRQLAAILENSKRQDNALLALFRAEIARIHREYTGMGEIDRFARETVLVLYEQYKALGGNGNIDLDVKELTSLKVMMPGHGDAGTGGAGEA